MDPQETTGIHWAIRFFDRFSVLFFWLRWFYPSAKGISPAVLLYSFFPQKVLRINGNAGWPVWFTSQVFFVRRIRVGNNTAPGLSPNCYIQGRNGIVLGHNVRIGPGVGLISADHLEEDYDRWVATRPITIGDNTWIGMNAVILPGVEIGENVVIGANSVVTKDIPANSVAVGAPCRVVRTKAPYRGKDFAAL